MPICCYPCTCVVTGSAVKPDLFVVVVSLERAMTREELGNQPRRMPALRVCVRARNGDIRAPERCCSGRRCSRVVPLPCLSQSWCAAIEHTTRVPASVVRGWAGLDRPEDSCQYALTYIYNYIISSNRECGARAHGQSALFACTWCCPAGLCCVRLCASFFPLVLYYG